MIEHKSKIPIALVTKRITVKKEVSLGIIWEIYGTNEFQFLCGGCSLDEWKYIPSPTNAQLEKIEEEINKNRGAITTLTVPSKYRGLLFVLEGDWRFRLRYNQQIQCERCKGFVR